MEWSTESYFGALHGFLGASAAYVAALPEIRGATVTIDGVAQGGQPMTPSSPASLACLNRGIECGELTREHVWGLVDPWIAIVGFTSDISGEDVRFVFGVEPIDTNSYDYREGSAVGILMTAGIGGAAAARALPALRGQYVGAVEALATRVPGMRQAGMGSEQIARALHAERRALGEQFKALTPADRLAEITQRNIQRYGDPLGPSVDWLRAQGKSWEQIIESASRAGGGDLGF